VFDSRILFNYERKEVIMTNKSLEVVEVVVKCRVPRDESEEVVMRLRKGERLVGVPEGLSCKDAFDLCDYSASDSTIIRAGFAR
jgi:hypothetical protein